LVWQVFVRRQRHAIEAGDALVPAAACSQQGHEGHEESGVDNFVAFALLAVVALDSMTFGPHNDPLVACR